jgi:hypothetical protein
MSFDVPARVHVVPLGIEHDRIVVPAVRAGADRVVLLDYLPSYVSSEYDMGVEASLVEHGIETERRTCDIGDLFDALSVFGSTILEAEGEDVYVNLSTGNKLTAIAGMIACMVTGEATPYYVEAEQHGSHAPPAPAGVRSIDTIPRYPMDRPEPQHLAVMAFIDESERTDADGEPYRIKRELFEYGERVGLPFIAEYEGETDKGKFRRLDAHVVSPLLERGYVRVEEVGTKRRVSLTDDGRNTLRAFRYLIE